MIPSITANIYSKNDVLLLDFALTDGTNHYYYTAILRCFQDLELQVYFDSSQVNCLFGELLVLNDSWMFFDKSDDSGKSAGFYFSWLQHRMKDYLTRKQFCSYMWLHAVCVCVYVYVC